MGENMELLQAQAHVWNHIFKLFNSTALKCAIELGIPDIIHSHGQPMSLSSLAVALHVQPSKAQCLGRLMRLLVQSGFFARMYTDNGENENVKYSLTPPSRLLLRHNSTLQFTPMLFLNLDKAMVASWDLLSQWLCSGDNDDSTAFEMANGKSIWDHVAQEHSFDVLFHQTMVCDSRLIGKVVTRECRGVFEELKSLVDVGGGTGIMANAIVEAFPHIVCTVFDLPQVIANLQPPMKNISFVGGDMFEEAKIPRANAILLKWILHNWNDEESIKILKNCKDAIPSRAEGGKVIIIDMVMENQIEDKEATETQLCFDLLMMVNFTGRERSEREWKSLFLAAGFKDYKIFSYKLGLRSLIEVYPN